MLVTFVLISPGVTCLYLVQGKGHLISASPHLISASPHLIMDLMCSAPLIEPDILSETNLGNRVVKILIFGPGTA